MNHFDLSVCIPTYMGANKISTLLKSLLKQTVKHFEVVVYIDGSTDASREMIEQDEFNILNIRLKEGANLGRAGARNMAAQLASSKLLVFVDDDIRLEEDSLEKHFQHHQDYPNSILAGALRDDATIATNEVQRCKAYWSRAWLPKKKKLLKRPFLSAANFSIAKTQYDDLGGFNEELSDLEDYEFAIRAFDKNISIYLDPEVIAWHHDQVDFDSYLKRKREYEAAQRYLYLSSTLFREYDDRSYKVKKGLKAGILRLMSSNLMVNAIKKEQSWFMLIPRVLRYKLIDLTLVALSKQDLNSNSANP